MTPATRLCRAHSVPDPRLVGIATAPGSATGADRRLVAYWRSSMPRLEVALAVDTPRVLKLFATRVLT
jgi:hypothetical protein